MSLSQIINLTSFICVVSWENIGFLNSQIYKNLICKNQIVISKYKKACGLYLVIRIEFTSSSSSKIVNMENELAKCKIGKDVDLNSYILKLKSLFTMLQQAGMTFTAAQKFGYLQRGLTGVYERAKEL